jgi:transcriptional regulator with XRE-family HTH domain
VRRKERRRIKDMTFTELASAPDGVLIARNFIRIRKNLGLTQAQAAELGEATVSYVGKVETAAVNFGTRAQQKWSRIFKVDRAEFLSRPDAGIPVVAMVIEKGTMVMQGPEHEVEHVASLPGHKSDHVVCFKVSTDALYPHLRRNSYLYIITLPVSAIRNDDLVVYTDGDGPGAIKEVELISDGKMILFKGLGRGSTISKEVSERATLQKVVFIGM